MRNLITVMVAGLFATGVFANDTATAPVAPVAGDTTQAQPAKKVKKHHHKKGDKHADKHAAESKDAAAGK